MLLYQSELKIAIEAAKEAAIALRKRNNIVIESQKEKDLKLSSDKMSEKIIIDKLQKETQHPILSEECGKIDSCNDDQYLWIIDPLDGTINYYKNIPELTCISIALWKDETPVLGVVYRYSLEEMYWGVIGDGAYCNGVRIEPSKVTSVCDAVIATGFPTKRDYSTESLLPFLKTIQQFKKVRMFGAAAIMGVFVADGKADVYYEDHIMLWDIAAAAAIVMAAGGKFQVNFLENNMCVCKLFANQQIMEDFNAKSL